jgi:hypothetical protein
VIRHNSLGQLIHPTEAGIVNFWQWFGKSKAVDEQGRPLVVYHGTTAAFDRFDRTKTGKGSSKVGFWFTDDRDFAGIYGGKVMACYLRILRPKRLTRERWNDLRGAHGGDSQWWAAWRDTALVGHDGVMVPGQSLMLGKVPVRDPAFLAVLDPKQVKAVANTGAFSRRTAVITNPSRLPERFRDIPIMREWAATFTRDDALRAYLKQFEGAPTDEVVAWVAQQVAGNKAYAASKRALDEVVTGPQTVWYRVVGGRVKKGQYLGLRHFDGETYEVHVAPTPGDALQWIPLLLRDDFLRPGVVSLLEIDMEGLDFTVEEDTWVMDKGAAPESNILRLRQSTIPADRVRVVKNVRVKASDAAPEVPG